MRRDGCHSKVRHRTQGVAVMVMKKMNNAQLNTYRCSICGHWHIGHSNMDYKFQRRIDQLLRASP